ncbi:cytochrome c biogenesis protein ResB, partial [Geoalkalibacter sp.]|uniref:cytochrome c biogenesis protein ResB n=1 Tax=Geoalkalibacter sp. TaxID=3041440 RepID=UPI00272EE513
LRQTRSQVTLLEEGRVAAQGEISINHPLVHNGIAIYQTAFDRDAYGFWYAGFQFSRDPGKPLVWAGCITLMLGLLLAFLVPYRVAGLTRRDGVWHLAAIRGFSGEAGDALFAQLVEKVAGNG